MQGLYLNALNNINLASSMEAITEILQLNTEIAFFLRNCSNNGQCSYDAMSNSFVCSCFENYTGLACEIDKRPCNSPRLQCLNKGLCINSRFDAIKDDYNYTCNCSYPFYGGRCELKQNLCKGVTCSKQGVCYANQTSYTCKCFIGYSGPNCEIESNQVKRMKAICNVSGYFSYTFIIIFYSSIVLFDICHYWIPIKRYFKRRFMRSTRKIIRYEIKDDVEEAVPTDEMKIKVENLDELKDMEQNRSEVTEPDIQNFDEIKHMKRFQKK